MQEGWFEPRLVVALKHVSPLMDESLRHGMPVVEERPKYSGLG